MNPPMRTLLFAILLAAPAVLSAAEPIPGIGPAGEIVRLHTGFKFTEGPAADGQGNIYFTDIPSNRIYKVDAEGKLSTFLEESRACNGLMFDGAGRLIACQGKAQRVIAIDRFPYRLEMAKNRAGATGRDGPGTPDVAEERDDVLACDSLLADESRQSI